MFSFDLFRNANNFSLLNKQQSLVKVKKIISDQLTHIKLAGVGQPETLAQAGDQELESTSWTN
jgi:hypothetical protein